MVEAGGWTVTDCEGETVGVYDVFEVDACIEPVKLGTTDKVAVIMGFVSVPLGAEPWVEVGVGIELVRLGSTEKFVGILEPLGEGPRDEVSIIIEVTSAIIEVKLDPLEGAVKVETRTMEEFIPV